MVLWCFNVTVPDLVSLRCYQRLKPQPTKNKVGSVSRLFFPSLWVLSLQTCLLRCVCLEQCSGFVGFVCLFLLFVVVVSLGGQSQAHRERSLLLIRTAVACLPGWALWVCAIFSGHIRKGVVAFRKESQGPCLFQYGRYSPVAQGANPRGDRLRSRGNVFTWPQWGQYGQAFGSCHSLVAPGAGTKGRCFHCPSMPPRLLLVGAKLLLCPHKLM